MRPLSVEEQDCRVRAEFPNFKLVLHGGWIGIWEGPLRPICQTYRVRIRYFSRRWFDGWQLANSYVSVTVLDPPVGPDPRGTGEPVPHVYRLGCPSAFPRLCVYGPAQDEWGPHECIADKIIPWILKWLLFYEDWVATGEWQGRGRHPEASGEPQCVIEDNLNPESHARRARFRNAEFHRLGQKTGVFASLPLMAAASAGCFPPQCWQDWSSDLSSA